MPASSTTLENTVNPVTATIGGVTANVTFGRSEYSAELQGGFLELEKPAALDQLSREQRRSEKIRWGRVCRV